MNKQDRIIEFLSGLDTEINIVSIVNIDNVTDYESLYREIEDNNGFDTDVFYYSYAIAYLQQHDYSLKESLNIANEMGFSLDSLDSEILASLLKTQKVREEFGELEEEINEFFNELDEELEEE